MSNVCLKITVPICGFRQSRAREYAETYSVPPPATLYGFLLALVGEEDRHRHEGVKLVSAIQKKAEQSTVLRKIRRIKEKELTASENSRPDYQELLTDLEVFVWLTSDNEEITPALSERVNQALTQPETIQRFGGLSLGESRDLVNEISLLKHPPEGELIWILPEQNGLLTLPFWVDHVGSAGTLWQRYSLINRKFQEPQSQDWTLIQSPQ
jgi:CRISPR-associated protein Cas5t